MNRTNEKPNFYFIEMTIFTFSFFFSFFHFHKQIIIFYYFFSFFFSPKFSRDIIITSKLFHDNVSYTNKTHGEASLYLQRRQNNWSLQRVDKDQSQEAARCFFFSPLSGLKSSFRVYPPSPLFFPSKIRNSTSDKKANMSRQLSMRHLSLLTSVTCKQSQRSFLPSSLSLSYCSLIQEKKKSRFSPRGPPTSCIYTYSLYIYIHIPDTMVEVVARQQCFPFLGTLLLKRPLFSFSLYLFLFPSHPSTILTRYH